MIVITRLELIFNYVCYLGLQKLMCVKFIYVVIDEGCCAVCVYSFSWMHNCRPALDELKNYHVT